jgi:hypothetical protein
VLLMKRVDSLAELGGPSTPLDRRVARDSHEVPAKERICHERRRRHRSG